VDGFHFGCECRLKPDRKAVDNPSVVGRIYDALAIRTLHGEEELVSVLEEHGDVLVVSLPQHCTVEENERLEIAWLTGTHRGMTTRAIAHGSDDRLWLEAGPRVPLSGRFLRRARPLSPLEARVRFEGGATVGNAAIRDVGLGGISLELMSMVEDARLIIDIVAPDGQLLARDVRARVVHASEDSVGCEFTEPLTAARAVAQFAGITDDDHPVYPVDEPEPHHGGDDGAGGDDDVSEAA
jgi:hypothetical protein